MDIVTAMFAMMMYILLLGGLFVLYMLPAIIARQNRKKNFLAIAAFNLLLGWSIFGWVLALVWSLMKDEQKEEGGL